LNKIQAFGVFLEIIEFGNWFGNLNQRVLGSHEKKFEFHFGVWIQGKDLMSFRTSELDLAQEKNYARNAS
jgi:hypothetical protein